METVEQMEAFIKGCGRMEATVAQFDKQKIPQVKPGTYIVVEQDLNCVPPAGQLLDLLVRLFDLHRTRIIPPSGKKLSDHLHKLLDIKDKKDKKEKKEDPEDGQIKDENDSRLQLVKTYITAYNKLNSVCSDKVIQFKRRMTIALDRVVDRRDWVKGKYASDRAPEGIRDEIGGQLTFLSNLKPVWEKANKMRINDESNHVKSDVKSVAESHRCKCIDCRLSDGVEALEEELHQINVLVREKEQFDNYSELQNLCRQREAEGKGLTKAEEDAWSVKPMPFGLAVPTANPPVRKSPSSKKNKSRGKRGGRKHSNNDFIDSISDSISDCCFKQACDQACLLEATSERSWSDAVQGIPGTTSPVVHEAV
jgi:hypothetical protein